MDTGERLAAYLSGDLDPDDATALEAELAGDAALRAHLDRIRRADEALAALAAEDVALPDGLDQRLRDAVAPALEDVLGDELAARRARRGTPRWLPAVGGVAAAVALVVGGVAVVGDLSGDDAASDDAGVDTTSMADEEQGEAGAFDAGQDDPTLEAMVAPEGPRVVDEGRTIDPDRLDELADAPDALDGLAGRDTDQEAPALADTYRRALGGGETDATAFQNDEAAGDGDTAADSAPADDLATARAPTITRGDVSPDDLAAVAACLPVVLDGTADPVIPLAAELATTPDGEDVIAYTLLSPDGEGSYRRVEVWLVDRTTCDVLTFVQRDR